MSRYMHTIPARSTLKRYGLTLEEWQAMYDKYDGTCHICKVKTKRLCVDHFHVPKWKSMPPTERKKYCRGLLCYICNARLLTRGVTIQKLRSAADYLEEWEIKTKIYGGEKTP